MKKAKFAFASANGNFYEPDRFENMYLLPGELESQHETKSNSITGNVWKRRNSLKNIMEEGPLVKLSDYSERPNKLFSSRPKQMWQTSPRSTGSRPWSASTALSSSSTSSSSSHYSIRRKTRVEIILEEYAKLRESEQRREERGFRQLIETELKNNHHPKLLMHQDSIGLDRRPASAQVYRSHIKKTKAHCQYLRAQARKYHIKNRARCQRKKPKRSKSTRHNPHREYVLFQSARFDVRVMNSAHTLACSVKISEKAVNGLDPATLIVRVWPLDADASPSRRNSAEPATAHLRKRKKKSKKEAKNSISLQIKLRDLRLICQHSSSVSAVLARCTPLPGLSVAANEQPVRLLDFILKPGRNYPHAIGRQISFQLGQCVMQALSLSTYPVARLVLTDKVIAAVRMQAHLRQWVVKKLHNKRKRAVEKVQHAWRVRVARSMLGRFRIRKARRELEHRSAVKIQRFWRKRVWQRNRDKAAIRLQRSFRGARVRRAISAMRIQCVWRCFGAVKRLLALKDRASKRLKLAVWLQSHYWRLTTQKFLRRSRAISRIQAFWRKYKAHTRMLEVRRQFAELRYNYSYVISGAITKLQRQWRARVYQEPSADAPELSQTIETLKNRYDNSTTARRMTRRMSHFMSLSELPTDTKPSTVALPMDTKPSTVALPMDTEPSTVALPMDTEPSTVALPMDTKPSTVALPMDTEPSTVALPMDTKPSTVALPMDTEPSTVALPMDTEPSTVALPMDTERVSLSPSNAGDGHHKYGAEKNGGISSADGSDDETTENESFKERVVQIRREQQTIAQTTAMAKMKKLTTDPEPATNPEELAATKIQAMARRQAQQRSTPPANEVREYIHSLYRHADAECNGGDIDKNLFLSERF